GAEHGAGLVSATLPLWGDGRRSAAWLVNSVKAGLTRCPGGVIGANCCDEKLCSVDRGCPLCATATGCGGDYCGAGGEKCDVSTRAKGDRGDRAPALRRLTTVE